MKTRLAAVLFVSLAVPLSAQAQTAKLTVELIDAESAESIPGVIRFLGDDGAPVPFEGLQDRCIGFGGDRRKLGWRVLTEVTELEIPTEVLKIEAFAGIEWNRVTRRLNLATDKPNPVRIELKRIFDSDAAGWVSGNTHLHLKDLTREEAERYLREVPLGDGTDITFVSYLERAIVDRTYITNGFSKQELEALNGDGLFFGNGEEHRHNFGGGGEGYGHVMFLNLKKLVRPVSIGPGITKMGTDFPPLQAGIRNAREQGATVVWCHNGFGFEDIPNYAAGLIDAQNIFDGGNRGSYEDTFYRYLNAGLKVPFSTGTDWFVYDFSRVFVKLPKDQPVTVENWLAALREGRSWITNSTLLEFDVNGKSVGEEIALPAGGGEITVKARAIGRHPFRSLEVIWNGEVIRQTTPEKSEARLEFSHPVSGPGWIALRIQPLDGVLNELGQPLFAHTSPVYVTVGGEFFRDPEAVKALSATVLSDFQKLEEQANFKDDSEGETVKQVFSKAIEALK